MIRNLVCTLLAWGALAAALAVAEEKKNTRDEDAIRQGVEEYVQAYNRGDAEALAKRWSENGVYVHPVTGQRLSGRQAITREFATMFAGGDAPKLAVTVDSLRFLGDSVAVEEGVALVHRKDEQPESSSYIAIHVKQDGRWLLDSVRETMLETPAKGGQALDQLEWMIGRWIDQDDSATVETVCEWTPNKAFIARSFKVSAKDSVDLSGTQIIGWDAAAGKIRSWVFDSDGGFGEGAWTRQGDRWMVKQSSTLPSGKKASAMQIITKTSDNSFTWESMGREVDGQLLPNIDPITIVRKSSGDAQ